MAQLTFDDWLDRKLASTPETVTLRDGRTVSTRDWVTQDRQYATGLYNRETLSPQQQQQAPVLLTNTAGVGSFNWNRDVDEMRPGESIRYGSAGAVPQALDLDTRNNWWEQSREQNRESFLFSLDDKGNFIPRADVSNTVNPDEVLQNTLNRNRITGSALVADTLATSALRGYLSAAGSSIGEPSRAPEFFFGRFGQQSTPQGRAQTDMALKLGQKLTESVRNDKAGLLGQALKILPDAAIEKLPLVTNVIGGAAGDLVSLFPARFAWRANPFDFGSTFLARNYADSKGIDAARATGNIEATEYNPLRDPALTARFSNVRTLARRDPAPFLKLGIGAGVLTTGVLSGNVGGWRGPDEGFRRDGYAAAAANTDDQRKTDNLLMSLVTPLTGGSNRLLPWEQFRLERPDVSREQYDAYRSYLRGDTDETPQADFSLFGGLIKGTAENIDGQPELMAVGGRVTPLGLVGGALVGAKAIDLLSNWINNPVRNRRPGGV